VQRLHRLADPDEPGEQEGVRNEMRKRKSKITQEKRQLSEQAPDLAMSFDALDVEISSRAKAVCRAWRIRTISRCNSTRARVGMSMGMNMDMDATVATGTILCWSLTPSSY